MVTLREFEGAVVIERHVGRRPQEALSADKPFQLYASHAIRPGFQRKFYTSHYSKDDLGQWRGASRCRH